MLFWDNAMQKSRFRQKKLDLTLMGDLNKLTQLKDFQLNGSDNVLVNYKCLLVNPSVLGNFSYNKTKTRWKCSKKILLFWPSGTPLIGKTDLVPFLIAKIGIL